MCSKLNFIIFLFPRSLNARELQEIFIFTGTPLPLILLFFCSCFQWHGYVYILPMVQHKEQKETQSLGYFTFQNINIPIVSHFVISFLEQHQNHPLEKSPFFGMFFNEYMAFQMSRTKTLK